VNDTHNGALGLVGVSLVFGLIVMAMIYSIGSLSGAHINPAVTLGLFFAGKLEQRLVIPYIISQLLGAIVAAVFLRLMFPEHPTLGATLPSGSNFQAFILEIALTFFLMFVILNVISGPKENGIMAGVVIGSAVVLDILFGGPVTGGSMNPARSFGPALISGHFASLWIYLIAPVAGAYIACIAHRLVHGETCCSKKE
jgi:aquaporin Z